MDHTAIPVRVAAAVVFLGFLAACETGLTGPDDGPLDIQKIDLSASSTAEVLTVSGGATRESAHGDSEATVQVTTAAGDRETVTVDRNICETDDGDPYVCDEFNLGLEDGVELDDDIRQRIRQLDGRITRTFSFGAATVKIFSGDLDDALEEARGWPGVEYAERNGIAHILPAGSEDADSVLVHVSGALPVSEASATPDDGILQIATEDTVRASHRAPDGDELTARLADWPAPEGN